MRIALYSSLTKPVTEVMGIGVISLALTAGAYLTLNQETHLLGVRLCDRPLDLPSLLIFYGLLIGATEPARKLSEIFNSLQAGMAAADRLFPVLDREPAIQNPDHPRALPRRHRRITFEHVDFQYEADVPISERYQFYRGVWGDDCHRRARMGVVRRRWCSCYPASSIRLVEPFDWMTWICARPGCGSCVARSAIVTQQSPLFDDTVFNNILSGRLEANSLEVHRAARCARADRFITEKLPDGYETVVGAGGSRLSGGQRQRVALARAILRDPEILILDEATSQIDLESEQLIHQALEEFAKDRTVFIVTHRLSTLALADRILVLDAGRVADLGTHRDLIQRCPLYERLYSLQFQRTA